MTNPRAPITADSPVPIYYQLKTLLLEQIASGRFAPGDRLPTEAELCERYGISRTPVHRALAELADEGVVVRRRRVGTFVNPDRAVGAVTLTALVTEQKWVDAISAVDVEGLAVRVGLSKALPLLHQHLTGLVGRGQAPDLALMDSVWVTEFARSGFIVPIDEVAPDWVDRAIRPEVIPGFLEALTVDGRLYAVPEEANVSGIWFRRDVLEDADPPATWEALINLLEPAGPLVFSGGTLGGETTTYWAAGWLASNGVRILDDGFVTLDGAAAVEALRFLRRLVDARIVDPSVAGLAWDRPPLLLAHGEAAASFGGSYEAATLARETGTDLESLASHFVFSPFPAGPEGAPASVLGGMVYVVFRQSPHPRAAVRLLEHLLDPEVLRKRSVGEPTIPPTRASRGEVSRHAGFIADTAGLLSSAIARPRVAAYSLVSTQIQKMVESVVTGRSGPAAAVERTAETIAAITGLPLS